MISAVTGADLIEAGGSFSFAGRVNDDLLAWGSNSSGRLGDGTTTQRSTGVLVNGLTNVTSLATGAGFAVAVRADAYVWSWGANGNGQLGIGSTQAQTSPTAVSTLSSVIVTAVAAGSAHGLALTQGGNVYRGARTAGDNSATTP